MPDQKITELAALTTPTAGDLLAIVDDPLGTPTTKKVTLENLISDIEVTAETASDPGRQMYLRRTHTSALGSGKGLTGVEVRSTFNGDADALTSEVKGGEFKARHTTGNTYDVGTFKGVIGNVDCKNGVVTTGWAVEGAIDVSSGGTFTTAACFHGNLNNSGTVTNSYGVYVHGLSGYVLTRGLYVDYATTGLYLEHTTTAITALTCTNLMAVPTAGTAPVSSGADASGDVEGSIKITVGGVAKYLHYWPNAS